MKTAWSAVGVVATALTVITTAGTSARAGLNQPGLNGVVRVLYAQSGQLFVGGDFTQAGAAAASHVAYWDNTGWHVMSAGLEGTDVGWRCNPEPPPAAPPRVRAILDYDDQIYAGGSFNPTVYGAALHALARWSGGTWSAAGRGMDLGNYFFSEGLGGDCYYLPPEVHCQVEYGGQLVVGGLFECAESTNIASWDGSAWHGMGGGLYWDPWLWHVPTVDALAVWNGDLVAGGAFQDTGTWIAINPNLARWTTESGWVSLTPSAASLDGPVFALAVFGNDLIVGGSFHHAGAVALSGIGRWDGTTWHALGDGLPSGVHSLCVFNGDLFADGRQWDGAAWHDVLVANGPVLAMAVYGDRLVAGGDFTSALGADCGHIVSWPREVVSILLSAFQGARCQDGVRLSWTVGGDAEDAEFTLWRESGSERQRVTNDRFSGSQQGYTDRSAEAGPLRYWLRLEADDPQQQGWFGPACVPALTVQRLCLYPNQPNPFNPMTTIRFDLPEAGSVRLAIHDVTGRLLKVLAGEDMAAGSHEAVWDGRDTAGRALASGSYFARLEAGGKVQAVRMSLIR